MNLIAPVTFIRCVAPRTMDSWTRTISFANRVHATLGVLLRFIRHAAAG